MMAVILFIYCPTLMQASPSRCFASCVVRVLLSHFLPIQMGLDCSASFTSGKFNVSHHAPHILSMRILDTSTAYASTHADLLPTIKMCYT